MQWQQEATSLNLMKVIGGDMHRGMTVKMVRPRMVIVEEMRVVGTGIRTVVRAGTDPREMAIQIITTKTLKKILSILNDGDQSPSFFLNMSHIHTIPSARRCLNVHVRQSVREITVKYKRLARKYHPDKWHQNVGCSRDEGTRIFQCIANAFSLLRQNSN